IKPPTVASFRLSSRLSTSVLRASSPLLTVRSAPARPFSSTPISRFSQSIPKMGVTQIATADEFKEKVLESEDRVVVDFFATWCGPCKAIAPAVEKLSNENATLKFYKVDVDELASVAADLGISAMPTFAFFKGGERLGELTVRGANPPAIKAAVQELAA
ncbi:thioredoxin, partial [Penicillium alfredii]